MASKIYIKADYLDKLDVKIQQYEDNFDSVTSEEDALVELREFAYDMLNAKNTFVFTYDKNYESANPKLDNTLIAGPIDVKMKFILENVDELNKLVGEEDRITKTASQGDCAWLWHQLYEYKYLINLSPLYDKDIDKYILSILSILDLV